MLDRIKVKCIPSADKRSVLVEKNDRNNRSSPKRSLNTVNKEIIYSKIDLQDQPYNTAYQNLDKIPGNMPLSDLIMSGLGS